MIPNSFGIFKPECSYTENKLCKLCGKVIQRKYKAHIQKHQKRLARFKDDFDFKKDSEIKIFFFSCKICKKPFCLNDSEKRLSTHSSLCKQWKQNNMNRHPNEKKEDAQLLKIQIKATTQKGSQVKEDAIKKQTDDRKSFEQTREELLRQQEPSRNESDLLELFKNTGKQTKVQPSEQIQKEKEKEKERDEKRLNQREGHRDCNRSHNREMEMRPSRDQMETGDRRRRYSKERSKGKDKSDRCYRRSNNK